MKSLGPGLVFAGTSIGVSHVVQSTLAGADYGFTLIWAVVLANVFKFPFFEYSSRYVAATGEHLLEGYRLVGKWAFSLFLILSLLTMFPIQAAVTMVATGLIANLINWSVSPVILSAVILFICALILLIGRYPLLDKSMKVMVFVLALSTMIAFAVAVKHGSLAQPQFEKPFLWNLSGISFLVALMGWMLSTIDVSVWHSFWCFERRKQVHYQPSMKEALFDFHLGYWGTDLMALLFLSLGALVMYGIGESFSGSAVTMFSTTISCFDAFPRIIREASVIIFPSAKKHADKIYFGWMMVVAAGSLLIIGFFLNSMKILIDVATTMSFLAAPVFAYINYHTVIDSHVSEEARPSRLLRISS
ncbi:MAG: Nramp family divalent metal transporter [Candidatus Omnitrophica bacterium]|nr:Nramp family divalent metal transporter [Candidatus Omnitrophota bacterium]